MIPPRRLQVLFPKLQPGNWEQRSHANARYTCMAFANGDKRHIWEAGVYGGRFYWPPDIRQDNTVEAWEQVFLNQGYERTENREVEVGFEKAAIYVLDDFASHVAISDDYTWLSKIGKGQDISHSSLDLLEGDEYGIVDRILKRPHRGRDP
jgi:hypothetical protein